MKKKQLYFLSIFGIIALGICVRVFIGEIALVSSNSMEPTLFSGDRVWIDKLEYGACLPKRFSEIPIVNIFTWIPSLRQKDSENNWKYQRMKGFTSPCENDIVVFNNPDNLDILLIKRISKVLHKGDTVSINYSNWKDFTSIILEETSISEQEYESLFSNRDVKFIYKLKNDYYFFVGDNVNNSRDSRAFGYVREKYIVGKVSKVLYSKKKHRLMLNL